MKKAKDGVAPISAVEVRATSELILASEMFINSPRMSRLLHFLVEKAISGAVQDTSEYAIGIGVFDRDPSVYSTSEDPIVRVQVGRLREKLKAYYASLGTTPDIEISIPVGTYMPTIRHMSVEDPNPKRDGMLVIQQIKCFTQCKGGVPFTQGLHEELVHQLFKAFGKIIVVHPFLTWGNGNNQILGFKKISNAGVNHLLEGSVRVDSERIRASVRLVDTSLGNVAWSEQFDRNNHFAISQQEELAVSICSELARFFCRK